MLAAELTGDYGGAIQTKIIVVPAKELLEPPKVRQLEHDAD